MTELWLEFTNDAGQTERIRVDRDEFFIGRHSSCDLSFSNPVVSRQHLIIARYSGDFEISDSGSSYGTTVNGATLSSTVVAKNGDVLCLGKEIEIRIEVVSDEISQPETEVAEPKIQAPVAAQAKPPGTGSIPTSIFFIAPIFVILILVCAGGGIFIAYDGSRKDEVVEVEDFSTPRPRENREPKKETTKVETQNSPESTAGNESETSQTPLIIEVSPTPKSSAESGNIEQISPSFLRKIVRNDPSAFLTSKQIAILAPKISQFKSSSTLAANIKDAKANSSQISALAGTTNLTAQFLATAALTKLGNQRGSVLDTAKSMVEVLEKLNRSIGVETADEAMLVIAAYNQGVGGQFTQLRNAVEGLSSKTQGVTARHVRTIWFLREKNKLSDAEFEFALRFLAIGTITQKPADFGVSVEALTF